MSKSTTNVLLGDGGGISIVNFEPFIDGTQKHAVAEAILESFKTYGFVFLKNHGIPQDKIDGMFKWSKAFFDQPMEVKQLAPHPASGSHHRGYSAPGLEKVQMLLDLEKRDDKDVKELRAKAPDVKESYEVGREEDEVQPNIWLPDGILPGFKEACLDFYWTCNEAKFRILSALAVGLHLPDNYFDQYHQAADNQLRLLHYPSVPVESLRKEEVTRIGAHTDFCSITMLMQDDVGGLEVEDPNKPGQFIAVPPVEGAIAVNAGDFLMRWSNDLIRSTVHRVRAPSMSSSADGMTPERYSIPYFCATDLNTTVECLPGTYSDERPKKYEPISALEYIMKRLAANY